MALNLTEDDMSNPEILGEKLLNLAEIVVRKHFYASYYMVDDLVSVAVLKAIKSIKEGRFDKSRGAFYNYIYTGMRNEIHNFLYHENKYIPVEDMQKYDTSRDIDFFIDDNSVGEIDVRVVTIVCNKFRKFGDNLYERVALELIDMGFVVRGKFASEECALDRMYSKEIVDNTIKRLCGCVVWEATSRDKVY